MSKFGNLILREERAIAKVSMDALREQYMNPDGSFRSGFRGAVDYLKAVGYTDEQAKEAASKVFGLQDAELCSKAQEPTPEAGKPQFQQPGQPAVPAEQQQAPANPEQPAQPVAQPAAAAAEKPAEPVEPKHDPIPAEQQARLETAKEVMGITDDAEKMVAKALVRKEVWEGDDRGITTFESREACLHDAIDNQGKSFDEASDICDRLAESSDWDDEDMWKSLDPAMGAVLIQDAINKSRAMEGMVMRVPRDVIAKICPSCGEKMAKANLKLLKIRVTEEDRELAKAIVAVMKGDVAGHDFRGNQYTKLATAAQYASQSASNASRVAYGMNSATEHMAARQAHYAAQSAHLAAARALGNGKLEHGIADGHIHDADYHLMAANDHDAAAARLGSGSEGRAQRLIHEYAMAKSSDGEHKTAEEREEDGGFFRHCVSSIAPADYSEDEKNRLCAVLHHKYLGRWPGEDKKVEKAKDAKGHGSEKHGEMTTEQMLNHVIANGQKIQDNIGGLGTILPDPKKLAIADAAADEQKAQKLAEAAKELAGMDKRTVGGEVRYYKTPTIYTPAEKRGGVRRWFEVRADGEYSIKDPNIAKSAADIVSEFVGKTKDALGHGSNKHGEQLTDTERGQVNMAHRNQRLHDAIAAHRAEPSFATKSEVYDAMNQRHDFQNARLTPEEQDKLNINYLREAAPDLLASYKSVAKVDQRPTESERNQVISEKWSQDVMDTSATANKPDNETFTKPENVGLGKALGLASAVQMVAKATPEQKYTSGGKFNGEGADKNASCESYMVEKGYSSASAKRICGQVAQHVGKNIEENEVMIAEQFAKTAGLDGSHRVSEALSDKDGGARRVGQAHPSTKLADQEIDDTGNTGPVNESHDKSVNADGVLEALCPDCGGNSEKIGLAAVDMDMTMSGKDVHKAMAKCAKCGAALAKDDDEGGEGDGGDDVEKTIRDFVNNTESFVAKHAPQNPSGLLSRMESIVKTGGQA